MREQASEILDQCFTSFSFPLVSSIPLEESPRHASGQKRICFLPLIPIWDLGFATHVPSASLDRQLRGAALAHCQSSSVGDRDIFSSTGSSPCHGPSKTIPPSPCRKIAGHFFFFLVGSLGLLVTRTHPLQPSTCLCPWLVTFSFGTSGASLLPVQ